MAAGVTLKKDALERVSRISRRCIGGTGRGSATRDRALLIDGAVSAGGFNLSLAELLARAGPYGAGNPEPLLALPAHTLAYADPVGENHIRARFRSGDGKFVNAIAFRAAGQPLGKALLENRGRAVHAAGHIAIDRWQGEERVQLRLTDLAAALVGAYENSTCQNSVILAVRAIRAPEFALACSCTIETMPIQGAPMTLEYPIRVVGGVGRLSGSRTTSRPARTADHHPRDVARR